MAPCGHVCIECSFPEPHMLTFVVAGATGPGDRRTCSPCGYTLMLHSLALRIVLHVCDRGIANYPRTRRRRTAMRRRAGGDDRFWGGRADELEDDNYGVPSPCQCLRVTGSRAGRVEAHAQRRPAAMRSVVRADRTEDRRCRRKAQ